MPDEKAFGTTTGTGVRADSQTLSGSDSYTIANAANDQNGGFSRTTTGTTTATLTEGGFATPHTQALSQAETGNYVSGRVNITAAGSDRYCLFTQFNNTGSGAAGAGTLDYSAVGAVYFVGVGVKPPTGGGAFGNGYTGTDAFFSQLGAASGSQAATNVRGLQGQAILRLTTGSALSGAAAQEVYRQMGNDLAHQYCFAAGTQVLLAAGSRKAIESILAGELGLAADDDDPEGCVQPRRVAEVYHNAPSALLTLYFDEEPVRTTWGHPFYVQGRGWTEARELRLGDRCLSHTGG